MWHQSPFTNWFKTVPIRSAPYSLLLFVAIIAFSLPALAADAVQSEWVHLDPAGRLVYKTLPTGDVIPDFSHAGYGGGGKRLPSLSVCKEVSPSGVDDSLAIQSAINAVAALPLVEGFRGAVLLQPGTYFCANTLTIAHDGIVLRGSGSHKEGTTIKMIGAGHLCFAIEAETTELDPEEKSAPETFPIADTYVPVGSLALSLKSPSNLQAGDRISIRQPRTATWIHFLGMDRLVRGGERQTWIKSGSSVNYERTIRAISGTRLTFDVPIPDAIDGKFLDPDSAVVVKITPPRRIAQCGIESLRIHSPPPSGTLSAENNTAVRLDHCEDCWVKDVATHDLLHLVRVAQNARRITIEGVHAVHTATVDKGAGYPSDFLLVGSQVLIHRSSSIGPGGFFVATLNQGSTLNVVLNCTAQGGIAPHARWSTSFLADSCVLSASPKENGKLSGGRIAFMNRGTAGSGQGWSIGWGVAWNCTAREFAIQQPPGAMNWCIGGIGDVSEEKLKKGEAPPEPGPWLSSHGTPVEPSSLYLAQLRERLGAEALNSIGY